MSHPCEGCIDWVPLSTTAGKAKRVCDYIGHTGHARILICPPGELCTVKSTVPREEKVERYDKGGFAVRQPGKAGPKERIPVGKVRELAALGWSDYKIAKEIGFAKTSVMACRRRHNIPRGKRKDGVSEEEIRCNLCRPTLELPQQRNQGSG